MGLVKPSERLLERGGTPFSLATSIMSDETVRRGHVTHATLSLSTSKNFT